MRAGFRRAARTYDLVMNHPKAPAGSVTPGRTAALGTGASRAELLGMFARWLTHFEANPARHEEIEAGVDWGAAATVDATARKAFVHSFQRFELGESGEGVRLLAKARAAGDPTYLAALTLLVSEERKHSALFGRGLAHLGAPTLASHWTDGAFTTLRRMLGLRTELALFLVAETVAMDYFTALAARAPDPVLRGIGRRIAADERNHIRFQIDRLRVGFRGTPRVVRAAVGLAWTVVAAGAATVLVVDHRAALRACGLAPLRYWRRAISRFVAAARQVLVDPSAPLLGPTDAWPTP